MTEKDQRPAENGASVKRPADGIGLPNGNAPPKSKGEEFRAQLKRRHDAARRMPVLEHSGRRDPAHPHEICGWWR